MIFRKMAFCLFPVSAALLLNCVVTMKSVKDPGFTEMPARVFIYVQKSEFSDDFIGGIGNSISSGLADHGVTCEVYLESGTLSLSSESELKNKITAFKPDIIMDVAQSQKSTINGTSSGSKVQVTLYKPGSDKPVWKGEASSQTQGWGGMGRPTQIAEHIIGKMVEDGLLKENVASTQPQ